MATQTPPTELMMRALPGAGRDGERVSWICSHCGESFSSARPRCPADGGRVIEDLDGRVFGGRYTVRELIGVGGMDSTVWKAWQKGTERAVAIKVLPPAEDAAAKRFGRGARIAANLTHPNCLVIHDYGTSEDGHLYLVMELLKGKPLQELLVAPDTNAPLATSVADAITIADQVLQALEHAHANRAVHRDLKPDNLFVTKRADGSLHLKILDFGIAKYIEEDPTEPSMEESSSDGLEDLVTEQRQVCGTPQYMAPEQVVGGRVDARTDLYSLGIVLYRMLTGRLPFDGKTRFDLYQKHLQEAPPPFREAARPGLEFPPRLELIVARALAKNPNQRFQSATEMRKALAEVDVGDGRARAANTPRVAQKSTSPRHLRAAASQQPPPLPQPSAPPPTPAPAPRPTPRAVAPPTRSVIDDIAIEKRGLTLELGALAEADVDDFAQPTLVLPDAPIQPRRGTASVVAAVPSPAQTEPSSSEQAAAAPSPQKSRPPPRRGLVAAVLIGAFLVGVGGVAGIMALVRGDRGPTPDGSAEVAAPVADRAAIQATGAPSVTADGPSEGVRDDEAAAVGALEEGELDLDDPAATELDGPTGDDPVVAPLDDQPVEAAAPTYEFHLDSVPRGAAVTLGDRDFGPTPATIDLVAGEHTLTMALDEHKSEQIVIRLGPDVREESLRRVVYLARESVAPPRPTRPARPTRPTPSPDDSPRATAPTPRPEPTPDVEPEPRRPAPALLDDEPTPTPRKPRVDLLGDEAPAPAKPRVDLLDDDGAADKPRPKPKVDLLD